MDGARVLVVGATGFLGGYVTAELRRRSANVVGAGLHSGELRCDLGDPAAIAALLSGARADRVLQLAAVSRMAQCEADPGAARAVNTDAPGLLARLLGPAFAFVSTDLVFDGRRAPYGPLDPTGPLSVYGQTKAEGEERVLAAGGTVVRLPLLFGPDDRGRGASAMVRTALQQGRPLGLFTNEYRTPLHAADAARALADLVLAPAVARPQPLHVTGPERVSRWRFGQRLCAAHALPADLLHPVECQDALRPRDVSLSGPPIGRSLAEMLADA